MEQAYFSSFIICEDGLSVPEVRAQALKLLNNSTTRERVLTKTIQFFETEHATS